jgi:glycosyltransferase involved in cell wall biosynthesis
MTRRIGVDARELMGDRTGVGRYLDELLRRWVMRTDAGSRTFLLYTPERLSLSLDSGAIEQRVTGRGRGTWWEQTYLRRAVADDQPDVFFAPAYTAPLGTRVPLAVTIHDISFMSHPEWFRPTEGLRRRWLTRRAAQTASVIFTVSAFSRSEILTHFRIDPSRVHVIPNGVAVRRPSDMASREPLVLYVGSIFNRRHLPDLIQAFARATHDLPQTRLVIVGDDRSWPPQNLESVARMQGIADRVEFRSYISEAELASLYARASVFGYLSEYEGFGLTPLEAMAAGVPSVVLDTPVAREVYADAVCYVPAGDEPAAAAAIRRLLTDRRQASALLARAPGVLARYGWDQAAERTLALIEGIARQ